MHTGFSGVPPVYTLREPLRPGGFAEVYRDASQRSGNKSLQERRLCQNDSHSAWKVIYGVCLGCTRPIHTVTALEGPFCVTTCPAVTYCNLTARNHHGRFCQATPPHKWLTLRTFRTASQPDFRLGT